MVFTELIIEHVVVVTNVSMMTSDVDKKSVVAHAVVA